MPDAPLPGLSRRQVEFMQVLQELVDRDGVTPSYDDLARELEMPSKSTVAHLVEQLEGRGYLRRVPHKRRSLAILRRVPMPDFGDSSVPVPDLRWLAEIGLRSLEHRASAVADGPCTPFGEPADEGRLSEWRQLNDQITRGRKALGIDPEAPYRRAEAA